jgi:hypothetical protein
MSAPAPLKQTPVETLPLEERIRRPRNLRPTTAGNRARISTTGSKPKRRFYAPKETPVWTKHRKNLSRPATLQRTLVLELPE